jgi:Phage Terminase
MASRTASASSAQRAARKRCTKAGCRRLAPAGRKRCDDHKPGQPGNPASRGPGRKLLGRTEARVYTPPLRPLNRKTSRGYEVIEFAEMIGEPLLPWQQWAVIHALELNSDGTFRFRTVLILVARQNGKSQLKRIVTLWRMYMDGARDIVGAAQDLSLARKQWQMCQQTIHACPDLEEEWASVRNVNGDEMFWAAGCCYAIKATNDKAGRGGSNDEVNIDELRAQKDWKAWGSLSKTTMARRNGQLWAMSNAGDDNSVVLNSLQAVGTAGTDPSLCLLEWSAPEGCELDDVTAWQQANPGLGYTVSEAAIRSALATDTPNIFRTEVLCQRVDQLDGAIDYEGWKDCADLGGRMDALRDRVAAVFDVAPDGQHFILVAAAMLADGRPRIEVVKAWATTQAVRADLAAVLDQVGPAAFGWFPSGPAAELATVLRPLAAKYNKHPGKRQDGEWPEDGEIKGARVSEVCMELAGLVRARAVVHADQELLNDHIRGASKLYTGDGWRFTRKGTGHCNGAYAAAGAVSAALTMPAPRVARLRFISY